MYTVYRVETRSQQFLFGLTATPIGSFHIIVERDTLTLILLHTEYNTNCGQSYKILSNKGSGEDFFHHDEPLHLLNCHIFNCGTLFVANIL